MILLTHYVKYATNILLLFYLCFLVSNKSAAQEKAKANPVTVENAIEIALENNLQLAAARKKIDAAEAEQLKSSILLPSNPELKSEIGTRNSPEERHTDYTISLTQEFEIYGQRQKRMRVAQKNIERVKYEIANEERNVIAEVKTGFYEALTSLEIVKLQEDVEAIFEKLWTATKERYDAGAISALELNSIKIGYGQARQQLLLAKKDYQNNLLNLKHLLGKPKDETLSIEGKLSYEKLQITMDDILAYAYKSRPDLKALENEKERASLEIKLRKSEIVPNPGISGFFTREEGTDDIVGGEVSISIPVWDRKQSELKKARTAKDVASININNKYLEIQKEVGSACRNFMAASEGIAIYTDEIMPQVEESLQLNEISYKEGKVSFIEFLTMQSNLLETRAAYLNALLDYNNAIVNLETVSGMDLISSS